MYGMVMVVNLCVRLLPSVRMYAIVQNGDGSKPVCVCLLPLVRMYGMFTVHVVSLYFLMIFIYCNLHSIPKPQAISESQTKGITVPFA